MTHLYQRERAKWIGINHLPIRVILVIEAVLSIILTAFVAPEYHMANSSRIEK